MRIVSLVPIVTDLLVGHGLVEKLCGISKECHVGRRLEGVAVVGKTVDCSLSEAPEVDRFQRGILRAGVDLAQLLATEPTIIFTTVEGEDPAVFIPWAEDFLEARYGLSVGIRHVQVDRLTDLYETIELVGKNAGFGAEARSTVSKMQTQFMQWGHLFFDRCKGKKCIALTGVDPLCVAPPWVTDIVELLGAKPLQNQDGKTLSGKIAWEGLTNARPDVLILLPKQKSLAEAVQVLPTLEALPGWDQIPAVMRGEVGFCEGGLFDFSRSFLKDVAILVSIVAGLDSGSITPRDSFYKLRYVELHRHKFLW